MEPAALIVFAGALFVAAASPGPAVAAIVARVLARGTTGALAFMLGIALGDLVWLTSAVLGLAFLAKSFALVFLILKYAGAAYLLYLAWRLWTAPAAAASAELPAAEKPWRLFVAGLTLMLGNPKVMVFYLALLPNLVDLTAISAIGFAELATVTLLVVLGVDVDLRAGGRARPPAVHQRPRGALDEPRLRGRHGRGGGGHRGSVIGVR